MTSTAWTITFDCADPAVLSAFWRQALGYVEGAPPAGFGTWEEWLASVGVPPQEWGDGAYLEDPEGLRPAISFLKVPEPKTAKNRVHLDVQAGGGRGEPLQIRWARVLAAVRRLTEAGVTVIRCSWWTSFLSPAAARGHPPHQRPGNRRAHRRPVASAAYLETSDLVPSGLQPVLTRRIHKCISLVSLNQQQKARKRSSIRVET